MFGKCDIRCDIRDGTSNCIQCSCISPISTSWALFKSPGLWDKFNLDYMSGKTDQLLKLIRKFRYLGMDDLPQEFLIENGL